MSGVAITVDAAPVLAYLRILSRKMDDMTPVMRAIGEIVVTQTDEAFEGGKSPAGASWPISRRAETTGGQTLIDTARLRNSIARQVTASGVTVGSGVVYAAIHQLGGATGRGHRTILPARPFLPDDASLDFDEITDVITRYLNT